MTFLVVIAGKIAHRLHSGRRIILAAQNRIHLGSVVAFVFASCLFVFRARKLSSFQGEASTTTSCSDLHRPIQRAQHA